MICVQSILIKVSWICLLIYVDDILMASKINKATDETANLIGKTVQLKYYLDAAKTSKIPIDPGY